MLYLEPGKVEDIVYTAHAGEEAAYVIQGSVEYRVGEQGFQLHRGDAIHYPSDRPHGFRNVGRDPAQILVVSTKRLRLNNSSSGTTGRVF